MSVNDAINGNTTSPMEIDEDLHSRQLAVYGRESMRRMAASSVLVVGLKGLGAEIGESVRLCFGPWLATLSAGAPSATELQSIVAGAQLTTVTDCLWLAGRSQERHPRWCEIGHTP